MLGEYIFNCERYHQCRTKNTLDEITINMYLSKHSKLSKKYDEYGGYGKLKVHLHISKRLILILM